MYMYMYMYTQHMRHPVGTGYGGGGRRIPYMYTLHITNSASQEQLAITVYMQCTYNTDSCLNINVYMYHQEHMNHARLLNGILSIGNSYYKYMYIHVYTHSGPEHVRIGNHAVLLCVTVVLSIKYICMIPFSLMVCAGRHQKPTYTAGSRGATSSSSVQQLLCVCRSCLHVSVLPTLCPC